MRVAVTGTPGTGKTSAIRGIETDFEVIHLNEVIREQEFERGFDDERETVIADMKAVEKWLEDRENVIIESHLAHNFPVDRVVVLRCHPVELERRLEGRGSGRESILENAESEALDLILAEAVSLHGEGVVYEIDTTDSSISDVQMAIEEVLRDERPPEAGTVSFIDYLDE